MATARVRFYEWSWALPPLPTHGGLAGKGLRCPLSHTFMLVSLNECIQHKDTNTNTCIHVQLYKYVCVNKHAQQVEHTYVSIQARLRVYVYFYTDILDLIFRNTSKQNDQTHAQAHTQMHTNTHIRINTCLGRDMYQQFLRHFVSAPLHLPFS